MSNSSVVENGPVMLQLHKWKNFQFYLNISEFREAFISPTRQQILLLSYNCEAVLLSLFPGNQPYDPLKSNLSEIEPSKNSQATEDLSVFEYCPVLSGVKSVAWGYCCDSPGQMEISSSDELLFVSSEKGIFVHIFASFDASTKTRLVPYENELDINYTVWGPQDTEKSWFRSHLTEIETDVSNGKFISKLPARSSAQAVSFSLNEPTLSFLEFSRGERETKSGSNFQCFRVLSSSSNLLVGLVMNLQEKIYVVVLRLYNWGMQWISCIDIDKGSDWVDFHLLDEFLICLNSSGLLSIWDLNSGSVVSSFDALPTSKFGPGFKKVNLLVDSNSLLLGVIDELGVIYLFSLMDILSNTNCALDRSILSSQNPNCNILTPWRVAGYEIGSPDFCFKDVETEIEAVRPCKRRRQNSENRAKCSSSFHATQLTNWSDPKAGSEHSLTPLRRVYLPSYRVKEGDIFSLSPFGITNNVRNCFLNGQKGVKITHTELFMKGRLGPMRETFFGEDFLGCSFRGSLYLIGGEAISVILPSVSVSSSVLSKGENQLRSWQMEILDRVLLYEDHLQADRLCLENGWDLKASRMRRIELALHYLKFDEIEESLNKLVDVNLAEEGVLRLLFVSVYQIFVRVGSENEVALSSRLMTLAARFATKMIHTYGLLLQQNGGAGYSRRINEMAYYLEVIRDLQTRFAAKSKKIGSTPSDSKTGTTTDTETVSLNDESLLPLVLSENNNNNNNKIPVSSGMELDYFDNLALTPAEPLARKLIIPENVRDMIARWEMSKFDFKNVVRDALKSGRIPLAVLQLQLARQKFNAEFNDSFIEVCEIGRSIVYDLFIKGETELAVATLEKLGEDTESALRQLLLGTVSRSIRARISEQMRKHGFFRSNETKTLERISLIERLYPSGSFWSTFLRTQKNLSKPDSKPVLALQISINNNSTNNISNKNTIECGEIEGAILGFWANIDTSAESFSTEIYGESDSSGYWACAAIWSDAWDQRTIDRIVLDRPYNTGVHVAWESQFEYHLSHTNLQELYNLIEIMPSSLLSDGILRVNLVNSQPIPDYGLYLPSSEDIEIEPNLIEVPSVRFLRFNLSDNCTSWIKVQMESVLAKRNIFLKDYWSSTGEILPVIAQAGLIFDTARISLASKKGFTSSSLDIETVNSDGKDEVRKGFHKLLVHYCVQKVLPYLLDFYLECCNLGKEDSSLHLLLEATGECNWAKWMIYSRLGGYEYEASFSNTRYNFSHKIALSGKPCNSLEIDGKISTIDDVIMEGGGVMGGLATLIYAPVPIETIIRTSGTLEKLRSGLRKKFSTLWDGLVLSCEEDSDSLSFDANNVFGESVFSDYLNWRCKVFSSAGGDTSLLQMVPFWFPKSVRRLLQLFLQGPFGLQSVADTVRASDESVLHGINEYIINIIGSNQFNAVSLESSAQKSIEQELYPIEEKGFRVEHYLHRGRALDAFNRLLGIRNQELNSNNQNLNSDLQMILGPLNQGERSILISVVPLAITNFSDSALVASSTFFLELCGVPTDLLRLDITVLNRISSFYNSSSQNLTLSLTLARELAEDYIKFDFLQISEQTIVSTAPVRQPARSLICILYHLERASIPVVQESESCGSWLLNGIADVAVLRSKQNEASRYWNLVMEFCRAHNLPLSMEYLALLARDNDWVGFLTEAQIGGFTTNTVIQVAIKEIRDPRLRTHILTVLRSIHSAKKKPNLPDNTDPSNLDHDNPAEELFGVLLGCEKQKSPGEMLLKRAKEMSWSLLAIVASCFADVSPLSCLTVWLEITSSRETTLINTNGLSSELARNIFSAIEATNKLPSETKTLEIQYDRENPKRRRILGGKLEISPLSEQKSTTRGEISTQERKKPVLVPVLPGTEDKGIESLTNLVAVLCKKNLFLPLLRAFEMFLPSCSLLPFIRSLQAFSQMRLTEASAHLASFSARIKEEPASLTQLTSQSQSQSQTQGPVNRTNWINGTAFKAAGAVLSACPSVYEKRCLLQLLAGADFGDGGYFAAHFRRLHWKISLTLAEDSPKRDWSEELDDGALLAELERNGRWDEARNWGRQLLSISPSWKSAFHHVTESQAEAMVAEWKEFLWDFPQERAALWGHCQSLFIRYSFPPLQAGLFFLKHAEAIEKEIPAKELHEMLLLSLQWLSGTITQTSPVYPLHLLREIETRVWLLAVESEAQLKSEGDFTPPSSIQNLVVKNSSSIIDQTAGVISKMDVHINSNLTKDNTNNNNNNNNNNSNSISTSSSSGQALRTKRRGGQKMFLPLRQVRNDDCAPGTDIEASVSGWEQNVGPADMERAVLSLLEFGQISAAKQLQQKASPGPAPRELTLIDSALKLASFSSFSESGGMVPVSVLDEVVSAVRSLNLSGSRNLIDPLQALEALAELCGEGSGRGLCWRIIAVVKSARILGLTFSEAFAKQPLELLQLLSLKAQDSLEEAKLLVRTHTMPAPAIAMILAESFLKGLLAAHRGGYIESQKEEGPAPLLWRSADFLKWAELCPSEPEIGHALMRLVMTGQEIPHACEVELLILSHHFYTSSACLDGIDVLVTFAANRVDSYILEGDFSCLARLITGVTNFHSLSFILDILIENGQLELLLSKYSAASETAAATGSAAAIRGFRMAVLNSLRRFNPLDLDAFAMVYNHFDMKHDAASLLESRSAERVQHWVSLRERDRAGQTGDLLESMRHIIEAAEAWSSIDAGQRAHSACATASLLTLQIRIPDIMWAHLSETNARRVLVEQSRFQEALIVAEAYGLNQPGEWAPVFWNLMLRPDLIEQFTAEFVAVLPLQTSMLLELARFYRSEVTARGDQSNFSVWLSPGGLPAEWGKHLGRSFRILLKRTRDLRVRMQLATVATGFGDVVESCAKVLDKVPDNAGPLILRRGHGGAYLPLM